MSVFKYNLLSIFLLLGCTYLSSGFDFCRLCGDGSDHAFVPSKQVQIPSYDFIETCGILNSTAASILIEGSPECDQVQSLGTYCGCQVQENPCQICANGGDSAIDPNVILAETDIPFVTLAGETPTCEMFVAYAASIDADNPICHEMQKLGSACGCRPVENYCELCLGERVAPEYLDKPVAILDYYLGKDESLESLGVSLSYTCEFLETTLLQVDRENYESCNLPQHFGYLCGCYNGFREIMGAETVPQRTVVLAAPRVSAVLSLFGSMAILYHVLKIRRRRQGEGAEDKETTRNRGNDTFFFIMVALASCDLCNSVAWIIGPAATPSVVNGDDTGVPGAVGNMATCKAQAWLVHFGYGCCLYSVSLAIYYKLRLVDEWKEEKLRRIRVYLIGAPLLVAVSLAMAGIPLTTPYPHGCHVAVYPMERQFLNVLFFMILPVGLSTVTIVYSMLRIYLKVRQVSRDVSSWTSSVNSRHQALERKTFWTACLYVIAFLITWPLSTALMLVTIINWKDASYGYYLVGLTVTPLQGFSNAIVYFSNHLGGCCCRRRTTGQEDVDEKPPGCKDEEEVAGSSSGEHPSSKESLHDDTSTAVPSIEPLQSPVPVPAVFSFKVNRK